MTAELDTLAGGDGNLIRLETFDLPGQEAKLVITTAGIVALGQKLADAYRKRR